MEFSFCVTRGRLGSSKYDWQILVRLDQFVYRLKEEGMKESFFVVCENVEIL